MGRAPIAAVTYGVFAALACGGSGGTTRDASSDGIRPDVASPLSLIVSVTGCATYDENVPMCAGPPPLTLSFAPVGSDELTQFTWTFGDGTPNTTERAPSHSYVHVGEYLASVTAGTADMRSTVTPPSPLIVRVEVLATGGPCDVDGQCGSGLTCACQPGTGCAAAFIHGVCSAPCDTAACASGAVCAAIALTPAADAGAPTPSCLASCETSACTAGYVCQSLPDGSPAPAGRWTRACLPLGLVGDVGASCRDPNEALSDRACATGSCEDVGALGVCSAGCDDSRPCPREASCARLPDGRQLCLRNCGSDGDCAADPLVGCAQTPAAAGGPNVSVCAPRSCANDNACPSGLCGPDAFCVRK